MKCKNDATRIRREVLIRMITAHAEGTLAETVDRIPYDMRPHGDAVSRCCVYKDRAMLRYRLMAALGFGVEDETEEWAPLADFAGEALNRKQIAEPVLTVLDTACQGCVPSRYLVTSACQGCLARPCKMNCAFDAVVVEDGRAHIDGAQCRNCGKCQKVCPYNAITRVPVPCQEACPVDAISRENGGKAVIDFEKCILCGRCLRACPFGAVMEKSQVLDVLQALRLAAPVVAMIAPSIAGQFPGEPEQIAGALRRLGFDRVVEVAVGADMTVRDEADEFAERISEGQSFMTTSCCPAFVQCVNKHLPELKPRVSHAPAPMHYTAAWVRERTPDAITVFVGPCVTKRQEAMNDPMVDYVLTFEEVGAMFVAHDIEVEKCDPELTDASVSSEGRGFAVSGGVSDAVRCASTNAQVIPVLVDGLNPKSIRLLRSWSEKGECPGNLIEVMGCEGGCVNGAGVVGNPRVASRAVSEWRRKADQRAGAVECGKQTKRTECRVDI